MLYNEIITANKHIVEKEKALRDACTALSRAINGKEESEVVTALQKAVEVASTAFCKSLREEYYNDKIASPSPMLAALRDYTFPAVKTKHTENEYGVLIEVEFVHETVDIINFETYANTAKSMHVMHKEGWKSCAEQVNDIFRAYRAQEHETKEKPAKAVSVNALREGLQRMYDCILFEDNGKGENKYLAKKSDAHAVYNRTTVYNKKTVNQYVKTTYQNFIKAATCAIICNVNGLTYEEYNKKATSAADAKEASEEPAKAVKAAKVEKPEKKEGTNK